MERRQDKHGRQYFINHNDQTTSWEHPHTPLPSGWRREYDPDGWTYFVDDNTKSTFLQHPLCKCPDHETRSLPRHQHRQLNSREPRHLPAFDPTASIPRSSDNARKQHFRETRVSNTRQNRYSSAYRYFSPSFYAQYKSKFSSGLNGSSSQSARLPQKSSTNSRVQSFDSSRYEHRAPPEKEIALAEILLKDSKELQQRVNNYQGTIYSKEYKYLTKMMGLIAQALKETDLEERVESEAYRNVFMIVKGSVNDLKCKTSKKDRKTTNNTQIHSHDGSRDQQRASPQRQIAVADILLKDSDELQQMTSNLQGTNSGEFLRKCKYLRERLKLITDNLKPTDLVYENVKNAVKASLNNLEQKSNHKSMKTSKEDPRSMTFEGIPERQHNQSLPGSLPASNIPAETPRPLDCPLMQSFHDNGSRNQHSPSSRTKLNQINDILNKSADLMRNIFYFRDFKHSEDYKVYKKGLNQLLLKLNRIDPEGKEEISAAHRNAVNIVTERLTELEDKANANAALY